MKKSLVVCLALIGLSGPLMADTGGTRHSEHRLAQMQERLSLSDQQASAMHDILQEQQQAMAQVRAETRSKINSILSPEQRELMDELRAEKKQRWQDRRERRSEKQGKKGRKDGSHRTRWGKRRQCD